MISEIYYWALSTNACGTVIRFKNPLLSLKYDLLGVTSTFIVLKGCCQVKNPVTSLSVLNDPLVY